MNSRKKIIRSSTVPQSLETFCKGILKELSEQYEVIALSSPGEALDIIAQREGVRTIAVPMERHISILKDLKSLLALIKVFRKERPDMVHSMTPKAGLLCMLAAWWTKVPVRIHTFTGLVFPTSTGLKKRILILTDRITCACATHVIPEGEGVKNDLIENKITRKPLQVLGYGNVRGVDMDYYSRRPEVEERADAIRNESRFSFLYVGRIVGDKGINELVSAFNRLNVEYPRARLFLVGEFENTLDPIEHSTKNLIYGNENIITVGYKTGTDLLAYYAASDCFVFPSYREGFPNTVLEAGAMGLPCIVTDINGSREIIKDGFNGLIVPSHDADALYEAMKLMLDNPQKLESMASVSREHIAAHFEQGYVRKCLLDYYREILKQ
jgi:glycosyltransferase involved in cell wall biosynthesis